MSLRDKLETMKDATPVVNIEWVLSEMEKEGVGEPVRWVGTAEASTILEPYLSPSAVRNLAARCWRDVQRGHQPEIRVRKKGGTDRSHWEMVEADVHRKRRQLAAKAPAVRAGDEADEIADRLLRHDAA